MLDSGWTSHPFPLGSCLGLRGLLSGGHPPPHIPPTQPRKGPVFLEGCDQWPPRVPKQGALGEGKDPGKDPLSPRVSVQGAGNDGWGGPCIDFTLLARGA